MKTKEIMIALAMALLLAVFISPFASNFPDGLERVAEDKHFIEKGREAFLPSYFCDYTLPFLKNERVQTALAGFFGVVIVFLITLICAKGIKKLESDEKLGT